MAGENTTTTVRTYVEERPGLVLVGALAAFLALDFLAKLADFRIVLWSIQWFGGFVAIERLLTLVWDGLVVGLAFGLAGIGLSMTYSILSFANFSHGDFVTSGAFAGWSVTFLMTGLLSDKGSVGYLLSVGAGEGPSSAILGINAVSTPLAIVVGLLVAVVATIALSLLVDRLVYEPMRDEGAISLLIASIGVALALRYVLLFVYTGTNRGLTAGGGRLRLLGENGQLVLEVVKRPPAGKEQVLLSQGLPLVRFGNYSAELITATSNELTLVVISIALMLGVHFLLQRTKLGKSMRAMADNEDLALVTGIPTERVITATWIIGGGLTGAAGYLIALETGTLTFDFGWFLLLFIFAAVILGGIGSIYGAMAGGVVIGLTRTVSLIWIPSDFVTAAAFGMMILVLLFKPEGLFGGVTTA
jgi:branched-chain amino acid transport system permease protein